LVGWWAGDGNANDIAGANNGILQGGATADSVGMCGSAFRFDGANGYVQIPDAPALKPTNLTVMCWVRFTSLNSAGNTPNLGQQYLIFKQNSRSSSFEGFDLSKYRANADVFAFRASSATAQELELLSVTSISTNEWYHVAGVRGSNFLQLYVNGELEAQTNVTFPQDYGTAPLFLGSSGESYYDRKLAGLLDEATLYNRALSAAEIAADYAAAGAGNCKAPAIVSQPQGGVRYWSSSISFTSSATGALPLTYQWNKDGVAIPGATTSSLLLTSLQLTDGGTYVLAVTNVYGSATSSPAILNVKVADLSMSRSTNAAGLIIGGLSNQTYGIQYCSSLPPPPAVPHWLGLANITLTTATNVWIDPEPATFPQRFYRLVPGPLAIPPRILIQPKGGTRYWGGAITFTSVLAGSSPLSYQWQKEGQAIAGATTPSLVLTNLQLTNACGYSLLVTNIYGQATSIVALLSMKVADVTISQSNGFAALTIVGLSNQTYGIQCSTDLSQPNTWVGLGNITATANTNVWTDPEPAAFAQRYYRVLPGPIPIPPRIIRQPQGANLYWSSSITLAAAVAGDVPLSYQWLKDGVAIPGATQSSLVLSNLQLTNSGNYSLVLSNALGSVSSFPAALNVRVADVTLARMTVDGRTVTALSVAGVVGQTYGIQFSENLGLPGTWIALTNLTLTGPTNLWYDYFQPAAGSGRYYRVVPGPILAPGAVPAIVAQPQGGDRYWGGSITFNSAASGVLPLSYQWQKDGVPIPGAINAFLVLTNLEMTNAGSYALIATNMFGAATSGPALLNVKVADVSLARVPVGDQHLAAMTLAGVAGKTYRIQCSASLAPPTWVDLTNITLTGPTNLWFDPQPATDPSRYYRVAQSTFWDNTDIGAVWSDDFNRDSLGTNWVALGSGISATVVSNELLLSQSNYDQSRQVYYQPWQTCSDAWTIRWSQRFGTLSSISYGACVGIKNFQAAGGDDRAYNAMFFGAGAYFGTMNIQRFDGIQHVLLATGSAIPVAAGDVLDCSLTRSGWSITATASNRANAQVSTTNIVFSAPANLIAPTISRVCLYPIEGTVYVDDISFTINHRKPARFLVVGASMSEGYNASSYSKGYVRLLQSNFTQTVCNDSSSYNTTSNSVSILPEILAHRPTTVLLMVGGNDLQFGYPPAQWQSQYSNLVAQLQLNGVKVKHCLNPPRNVVNLVPLVTWISSNYPASDVIDTWTPFLTGVSSLNPAYDSGDGVHPNDAGHALLSAIISTNAP
jgi:lysophospholipase L1-like esterase